MCACNTVTLIVTYWGGICFTPITQIDNELVK